MLIYRQASIEEEPFEKICEELLAVSLKLQELLPDPSLSPDERLERLARVVPGSVLISANHRTGRSKLNALRFRLAELVPNLEMSSIEKIKWLEARVHELVPENTEKIFKKLEKLGDQRRSDNGR